MKVTTRLVLAGFFVFTSSHDKGDGQPFVSAGHTKSQSKGATKRALTPERWPCGSLEYKRAGQKRSTPRHVPLRDIYESPAIAKLFPNCNAKRDMRCATPPIAQHSAFPREIRLERSSPLEAQNMPEDSLTLAIQYASTLIRQNRTADGQIQETAHLRA